jgi:hypothetical protein
MMPTFAPRRLPRSAARYFKSQAQPVVTVHVLTPAQVAAGMAIDRSLERLIDCPCSDCERRRQVVATREWEPVTPEARRFIDRADVVVKVFITGIAVLMVSEFAYWAWSSILAEVVR